jgi:hypothetical protein
MDANPTTLPHDGTPLPGHVNPTTMGDWTLPAGTLDADRVSHWASHFRGIAEGHTPAERATSAWGLARAERENSTQGQTDNELAAAERYLYAYQHVLDGGSPTFMQLLVYASEASKLIGIGLLARGGNGPVSPGGPDQRDWGLAGVRDAEADLARIGLAGAHHQEAPHMDTAPPGDISPTSITWLSPDGAWQPLIPSLGPEPGTVDGDLHLGTPNDGRLPQPQPGMPDIGLRQTVPADGSLVPLSSPIYLGNAATTLDAKAKTAGSDKDPVNAGGSQAGHGHRHEQSHGRDHRASRQIQPDGDSPAAPWPQLHTPHDHAPSWSPSHREPLREPPAPVQTLSDRHGADGNPAHSEKTSPEAGQATPDRSDQAGHGITGPGGGRGGRGSGRGGSHPTPRPPEQHHGPHPHPPGGGVAPPGGDTSAALRPGPEQQPSGAESRGSGHAHPPRRFGVDPGRHPSPPGRDGGVRPDADSHDAGHE